MAFQVSNIGIGIASVAKIKSLTDTRNKIKLYSEFNNSEREMNREITANKSILQIDDVSAFYELSTEEKISYIDSIIKKCSRIETAIVPAIILNYILKRILNKKMFENLADLNEAICEFYIDAKCENTFLKPNEEKFEDAYDMLTENFDYDINSARENTEMMYFEDEKGGDEDFRIGRLVRTAMDMKKKVNYKEYLKWLKEEFCDKVYDYCDKQLQQMSEKIRECLDYEYFGHMKNYYENISTMYEKIKTYDGKGDPKSIDDFFNNLSYLSGVLDSITYKNMIDDSRELKDEKAWKIFMSYLTAYHNSYKDNFREELFNCIRILKNNNYKIYNYKEIIEKYMELFDLGFENSNKELRENCQLEEQSESI